MKRDYLSVLDLTLEETKSVIEGAIRIKKGASYPRVLSGKHLALIFEKPSLRTRVTFEVAINRLGGTCTYLAPADIQLGKREPVKDVARNLVRWVDGVVARVFSHDDLLTLAEHFTKPVINALSDIEHPCQALADYMTIFESTGKWRVNLVFVGDGNNVATSLMLMTAMLGGNFILACPEGYEPPRSLVEKAKEISQKTGGKIRILNDPKTAVKGADFIYTDVWASMGQEKEAVKRKKVFKDFQVNKQLLTYAPEDVKVMHCLPAHRGEEITDEVIESDRSLVFEQAESRLLTEITLLLRLYGGI